MEKNYFDNFLNENLQNAVETQFKTQIKEPFEDPEENFGRLKEYFKFLHSPNEAENNIETNYTIGEKNYKYI